LFNLLIKIAGIPFTDERIKSEDWPALKSSGRFPVRHNIIII
jgi:hypothetical protein